jgi:hypothetical protein
MKSTIMLLLSLLLISGFYSCKKFDQFQSDPNRTTESTPDLLLTTIEQTVFNEVSTGAALASRQLVFTDGVASQQYYGWQRGSFDDYNNLRQVIRMETEAKRLEKPLYLGIAKFFRAYLGLRLTLTFGDVPYYSALKGDSGIYTSQYDPQEQIFSQMLNDLDEANNILSNTVDLIQGDIIYSGDILKWRKLVNTFALRVLMNLSEKEGNSSIDMKQRFAAIVNDPAKYPLFTSNDDNAQLTFYDLQLNRYPHYNNNEMQTAYYMEESFVDTLKKLKDPRLFRIASKAPVSSALPDNDFNAYGGLNGSAPISDNTARAVAGEASKIKPRYYNDPVNEPSIAVSFSELQFLLAEAVLRGWITGDAETYYKNGIRASMEFYGISSGDIDTYLSQPEVGFQAGSELQSIITQKYIASFMNSGWLPFFEQRRTGFPEFDVSGGGVLNENRIPKRWMYPETELQLNETEVKAGIARQFPQGDDVNELMWLLK